MTWYLTSILTGLAAMIAAFFLLPMWWDIGMMILVWTNTWVFYRRGIYEGEKACSCLNKPKV